MAKCVMEVEDQKLRAKLSSTDSSSRSVENGNAQIPSVQKIWTIKEILDWSSHFLKKSGSPSSRLDVEILLSEVLSLKRIDLYVSFDKPVDSIERNKFKNLLKRRANSEPIAYILGKKGFFGLDFHVTKDTLIPRPETEHLISWIIEHISRTPDDACRRLLEIGSGSGCIAVSLAKNIEKVKVNAWELSSEAIKVSRQNAETHGVSEHIEFEKVDALDADNWKRDQDSETFYDLIVSNPPYVSEMDTCELAEETMKHEPSLALFASNNGMKFYEVFAREAGKVLKPNAPIVLEIGFNQKKQVMQLFENEGWNRVEVHRDYAGHPRVLIAFNSSQV